MLICVSLWVLCATYADHLQSSLCVEWIGERKRLKSEKSLQRTISFTCKFEI